MIATAVHPPRASVLRTVRTSNAAFHRWTGLWQYCTTGSKCFDPPAQMRGFAQPDECWAAARVGARPPARTYRGGRARVCSRTGAQPRDLTGHMAVNAQDRRWGVTLAQAAQGGVKGAASPTWAWPP